MSLSPLADEDANTEELIVPSEPKYYSKLKGKTISKKGRGRHFKGARPLSAGAFVNICDANFPQFFLAAGEPVDIEVIGRNAAAVEIHCGTSVAVALRTSRGTTYISALGLNTIKSDSPILSLQLVKKPRQHAVMIPDITGPGLRALCKAETRPGVQLWMAQVHGISVLLLYDVEAKWRCTSCGANYPTHAELLVHLNVPTLATMVQVVNGKCIFEGAPPVWTTPPPPNFFHRKHNPRPLRASALHAALKKVAMSRKGQVSQRFALPRLSIGVPT
jgi:hypothetical protein